MTDYHRILKEYVRNHALSAMLQEGWAFKPAKSYGWQKAARGADFHVDQPLRTHILNGLYVLTRVLEFLQKQRYYTLSEGNFRRTLVLHTLHDAYKDKALAHARMGKSDFDIPLTELEGLYKRMGLDRFIDLTPADLRAASVALLSPKVGDISAGTTGITRLFPLVHMADALASQQTARDYKTAENRLREISRGDASMRRNNARIRQRLDEEIPPEDDRPELAFYYHELDDYRGLSTLLIHQATEEALAPLGLYPLLYFANGILYVGTKDIEADIDDLRQKIAETLFEKMRQGGGSKLTVAQEACDPRKGMKIEKYAYFFCSLEDVLNAVIMETPLGNARALVNRAVTNTTLYEIAPDSAQDAHQCRQWQAATKLIMATENIAQALITERVPTWLMRVFHTPESVAATIRDHFGDLNKGGIPNYCYIVAYHWLVQARFLSDRRTWLEVEASDIQQGLRDYILQALASKDQEKKLLTFVEQELGIQEDLKQYLQSNLIFSFASERQMSDDPLIEYEKARHQSHKHLCTICNRLISSSIKNAAIKTTIAQQNAQVFSNRRLPTTETKNDMMVWCPMCYLEFMLRKLSRQSYPKGCDYNASYRLYLYILPDYSFTPELWRDSGEDLLEDFQPNSTTVTNLVLRGTKEEPALPRRWLEHGMVDEAWLKQVSGLFTEQAERMKTRKQGDRLIFSFEHPNYMLFTYDNVVFPGTDNSLRPTRTEIWAKALYAAALLQLLIGTRVYITDKPYLTFTRPEEMKTIIEMEGLPPLFSGLFPISLETERSAGSIQRASESSARLPLATLSTMLDLLAAVWEINAALHPLKRGKMRNLDKQIASILQEINTNYLAGAAFYKMLARDNSPFYPVFTRACRLLLPQTARDGFDLRHGAFEDGYTWMLDKEGEAWMNLAQEITDLSLQLYRPNKGKDGRGRAHRFETLLRTGIEALKGTSAGIPNEEERVARVAGRLLKRLERLQENRQQGYVPLYGTQRIEAARKLAELLVIDLFHKRCGGSIARLTHEENDLADAIYFLTFEGIQRYWEEKKKTQQSDEETPDGSDQNLPLD